MSLTVVALTHTLPSDLLVIQLLFNTSPATVTVGRNSQNIDL